MEKSKYFVLIIHYDDKSPELNNYASFKNEFLAKEYAQTMLEQIMAWDPQLKSPKISDLSIYDSGILKYVSSIITSDSLKKGNSPIIQSEVSAIIHYFKSHYRNAKL